MQYIFFWLKETRSKRGLKARIVMRSYFLIIFNNIILQGNYCHKMNYDPEDPRCAHLIITGTFIKLDPESDEEEVARTALFSRHPVMNDWPEGHHWFFAKINITNILILDFFGGAVTVPVQDYFNAQL